MSTDFEFGWNDPANNLAPWGAGTVGGQNTESGRDPVRATGKGNSSSLHDPGSVSDELLEITCATVTKMVRNITDTVRKGNRMAIKAPTQTGRAPAPQKSEGGGDFNPWLKVHELINKKVLKVGQKFKMKIIEAREAPEGNISDVIADVEISGKLYAWGLSADKKAYGALYEKFGDKLEKWRGPVNCLLAEPFKKGYNPSIQVL